MTPQGRSQRVAALLLIVLPLFGCGSSPQKKAELAERAVRSWAATVRLTWEALTSGAVPRVYGQEVFEAAEEARQQQSKKPEWNALPRDLRSGLDSALQRLESAVEQRGRS
jgi:hypothetical protein